MTPPNQSASPVCSRDPLSQRLRTLAVLFLKLGTISFGGPVAHIALLEDEVVRKRQWLTKQRFVDMLGLTNLIPGPNSTEMAINVGFARAGFVGLIVAGASFIIPAALITGVIAWAYVRFGTLPAAESLLAGLKPAVIAVIAIAVWRLGRTAVRDGMLALLGTLALVAFMLKQSPFLIMTGGGLIGMLAQQAGRLNREGTKFAALLLVKKSYSLLIFLPASFSVAGFMGASSMNTRVPLARLGWFFLKVGAVLYGGGYVLLAFLDQGLVRDHHWLTQKQLLDAIAIGQFTPGPVLSTATFIGYLIGGPWGAVVATIAIFLPSFFYVAALGPVLPKLRRSAWMAAFLDSVNVCAVALMAGVTVTLARDALQGRTTRVIAVTALLVLLKWKISPAWIVLAGGIAGLVLNIVK